MASARQVVKMPAAKLTSELRAFLDLVVVPAVVAKYFAECSEQKDSEKVVALPVRTSLGCAPANDRRAK
jgi:hypothetical protein